MASTNTLGTPWGVSCSLGELVVALVARCNRARERSRRYRRVYDELMAYRDRELTDLGLARADIRTIAKRAADEI